MIDFNLIKELSIVEGNVLKIENEIEQVIWAKNVKFDRPIKLGVKKITASTYAGEITYENEEFILLDIYPETADSIINVTYEGLTKTLTFDGTNAKQVYFGTFNGVPDSILTPSSGILTIEGQCIGFGCSSYIISNKMTQTCSCITHVYDFGNINIIPFHAFENCSTLNLTKLPTNITRIMGSAFKGCTTLALTELPPAVKYIGAYAFSGCENLLLSSLPRELSEIGTYAFEYCTNITLTELPSGITSIPEHAFYKCSNIAITEIPEGVTSIGQYAFYMSVDSNTPITRLTTIKLPATLQIIGDSAFCADLMSGYGAYVSSVNEVTMLATTPPTLGERSFGTQTNHPKVYVPKGCSDTYKSAEGWNNYPERIVEVSE